MSREHGFVYYEGDCFLNMRNPYIPPHVENPSLAQFQQRKLSGNGKAEREKVVEKVLAEYKAVMEGKAWDEEVVEEGAREMFKDIVRERARLGCCGHPLHFQDEADRKVVLSHLIRCRTLFSGLSWEKNLRL